MSSVRRHLGGGIWGKISGRTHLSRQEKTSEERHVGKGTWEDSGKTWDLLGALGNTLDHLESGDIWNQLEHLGSSGII